VTVFGDLADGRRIFWYGVEGPRDPRTTGRWELPWGNDWWVLIAHCPYPALSTEDATVVACSLPEFFERLLHAPDPLFFDAPDFIPPAVIIPT